MRKVLILISFFYIVFCIAFLTFIVISISVSNDVVGVYIVGQKNTSAFANDLHSTFDSGSITKSITVSYLGSKSDTHIVSNHISAGNIFELSSSSSITKGITAGFSIPEKTIEIGKLNSKKVADFGNESIAYSGKLSMNYNNNWNLMSGF
ncbi:MAG: hypothetical protein GY756_14645 [bacterium]|nr:hypothetical protein [bacterium]